MIFIASDHGGFDLKKILVDYFATKNILLQDLGPDNFVDGDDYPDYVMPLVQKVLEKPENKGIVICRNGVGVSMLANKFKGIRCALSWNPKHTASARNDDDINVLALPADYLEENEAKEIVRVWFETKTSIEPRHVRRLAEVNCKGQQI